MIGQNREVGRRSRGPVASDEGSASEACSRDELAERYATGRERREILARAREDAGMRVISRRSRGGLR